jgi:hypothetical protein
MPIVGEIVIGPGRKTVRFRDPLRINRRVVSSTMNGQSPNP